MIVIKTNRCDEDLSFAENLSFDETSFYDENQSF